MVITEKRDTSISSAGMPKNKYVLMWKYHCTRPTRANQDKVAYSHRE